MADPSPLRQSAATDRLRRENTALVLTSLRDDGPTSRASLAQRTGLAKATVSAIVAELTALGAVLERPAEPSGAEGRSGRPGRPVALDGAGTVGLGLEVNVDYVAATALDLAGRTVLSRQVAVPPDGDALAALVGLAERSVTDLAADGRSVLGAAVAVPGQVERGSGRVLDAPNLGWHDRDVATDLAVALDGLPLHVDNDANCAAAGEAAFGAGRGVGDLLYLTGTVGVGAGLVIGGRVRGGASGLAGEVGHAPLGEPDRACACGRTGCWETAVGLQALLRETGVHAAADAPPMDPVAAAALVAARAGDDPAVAEGLRRYTASLVVGLRTLTATLDPELIVLGGSFVPLGAAILPEVSAALADHRCRVALSTLGLHAASTGAAAAVLSDVYAGTLALA